MPASQHNVWMCLFDMVALKIYGTDLGGWWHTDDLWRAAVLSNFLHIGVILWFKNDLANLAV